MSILEIENLSIQFPGVTALDNVSFTVPEGEVLGLCGENGAGKSSLAKILSGVYDHSSYTGTVRFDRRPIHFDSPLDAKLVGITMVHQDLNPVTDMTVAENIFLDKLPNRFGVVDFKKLNSAAEELLREVGLQVDPSSKVRDLSVSKMQMLEIATALASRPRLLILDEASSALAKKEADKLMGIIDELKDIGTTIIFISHKLEEIMRVCDRVVVLKDGCFVTGASISEINTGDIVRWMVGRDVEDLYPARIENKEPGEVILKASRWRVFERSNPAKLAVDDVSFEVREGEILGFYGLIGSGRSELMEAIFQGADGLGEGQVFIKGRPVKIGSAGDSIKLGISLVTESRKDTGLVLTSSVRDNIVLASLKKFMGFFGVIDEKEEGRNVKKLMESMKIHVPSSDFMVSRLSGGNQQKVVLSKWLRTDPDVLILDEPTKGIDVSTRIEIYKMIRELAEDGLAVVMVSSEIPEILGVSDRIITMRNGRITGEMNIRQATEEKLVQYALGEV